jgi:hypothetical protein
MFCALTLQADEPGVGGENTAEKSIRIVSPVWLVRFATPFGTVASSSIFSFKYIHLFLALATDVPRSSGDDFNLQRKGYANAITAPEVLSAIMSRKHHAIAVTFVGWPTRPLPVEIAPNAAHELLSEDGKSRAVASLTKIVSILAERGPDPAIMRRDS